MMKKKENVVKSTGVVTPVKEVVKTAAAVKAEEKVAAPSKVEDKKAEDKEKVADPVKKSAAAKKTTKTTTAKAKTTVTETKVKTAKSENSICNYYVQFAGREISTETIQEWVKADFVAAGHKESEIKELKIYIKPEDKRAYYVVNENYTASISLA